MEFKEKIEFIIEQEEIREKKLKRKVTAIIVSMIFILIGIIIVEFKEYSNNYNEYKIGRPELGPKDLVWAGIMGTPPRYYESDTKYGLGYMEFATREIRKALEAADINLIYRYMSPNRLEFEFERKHPICFYDRKWSNPQEYFKKPRHPILSIPLNYSGNLNNKKIFFRKGERARFEKHLDSKGNIILESLIKDQSLKTELIRKVEYDGPYANVTYGKRQLDGTYYDYIKNEYRKNIDLIILHTNDQIIQMLSWKRIDYQFIDVLEYDDYIWGKGGEKGIETLSYAEPFINGIDSPHLIFHSVACGNHPLTKKAMPIINEIIKSIRQNPTVQNNAIKIERKLNPRTKRVNFNYTLASPMSLGNTVIKADQWYLEQFSKKNMTPWPMFNEKIIIPQEEIKKNVESIKQLAKKRSFPKWMIIERTNKFGEIIHIISNETLLKNESYEYIFKDYFLNSKQQNNTYLDKKIAFKELSFDQKNPIENLIIFARGIDDHEFKLLFPIFKTTKLKKITLVESSESQSKEFIHWLKSSTPVLEQLYLYDVPLIGLPIGKVLKKFNKLRALSIHSDWALPFWVEKKELISIMENISENIETLSFKARDSVLSEGLPIEMSQTFAQRNFKYLKNFTLSNFYLDDRHIKLLFDGLPLTVESIILETSSLTGMISSLLLEDFLNKRLAIKKLKRLRLSEIRFSIRKNNYLYLPDSLEDLALDNCMGLTDSNFHRIIISPKIRFKNLSIGNNSLNDFSIINLLRQLSDHVETLDLTNNRLTGTAFLNLFKELIRNTNNFKNKTNTINIENLNLSHNPINDLGIFALTQLPWSVKELNISNLSISDISTQHLTSTKKKLDLSHLISLKMGNNYISAKGINTVLNEMGTKLRILNLSNVLSIDIKKIADKIPKNLESLYLDGNILNDQDISYLAPRLPINLNLLSIRGSSMGANGALSLAKNMPNLNKFYFDFKYGEEELGFHYFLHNLSPYLALFSSLPEVLSYKNALLLAKSYPPYLYSLDFFNFENEDCKIALSSLPHSLRTLHLQGDLHSTGGTLQELSNHFPSHLLSMGFDNSIEKIERDTFLKNSKNQHLNIGLSNKITTLSQTFIKYNSFSQILIGGQVKPEYFSGIDLPASTCFIGSVPNAIPPGFLATLKASQLKDIKFLCLERNEIDPKEFVQFLKKLPKDLLGIQIGNKKVKPEDMDMIISALPEDLQYLLFNAPFGEEGEKKLKEYKINKEEKTGLHFELLVNTRPH